MTVIKNTTVGRYSTDAVEVMTHVRKPVFVDNAVHHARITLQKADKAKVIIEKNNTRTLQVMPQRAYQLLEGESYVQLTHVRKPGHSSLNAPFFNDETISATGKNIE